MPRKGEALVHTDVSCTAKTRDGDLCKNARMIGAPTCRMHGSATKAARAKAEERILAAADPAAAKLVELMSSKKVPHNVQLAAARDLLDRAGIGTKGNTVELVVRRFEESLDEIYVDSGELAALRGKPDVDVEILEAELVDEQPSSPPRRNGRR